jgi:hypothetical protein
MTSAPPLSLGSSPDTASLAPRLAALPRPAQEAILRIARGEETPLDRFWIDPTRLLRDAEYEPDPWQSQLLRSYSRRKLLLNSRQSGKSLVTAAIALRTAFLEAPALVLLLSPTERQSGELFKDKVKVIYDRLKRPVPAVNETALTLELANGSRIIALPGGKEESIRGYSGPKRVVLDEAARIADALYASVKPMLAISRGAMVALSSAYAKTGWFYSAWKSEAEWERVRVPASECPRIDPEFLKQEREDLGDRIYMREYECVFSDADDAVFAAEDIAAACVDRPGLFKRGA